MYTSGTTGDPKGVLLSHANIVSEVAGIRTFDPSLFSENDYHMSYLPLAHSFERVVVFCMISYGAKVGFYQGVSFFVFFKKKLFRLLLNCSMTLPP
jgi:long-chain acyl-CoA synthetase